MSFFHPVKLCLNELNSLRKAAELVPTWARVCLSCLSQVRANNANDSEQHWPLLGHPSTPTHSFNYHLHVDDSQMPLSRHRLFSQSYSPDFPTSCWVEPTPHVQNQTPALLLSLTQFFCLTSSFLLTGTSFFPRTKNENFPFISSPLYPHIHPVSLYILVIFQKKFSPTVNSLCCH